MVILVVATTADPASIGPASSFLSMPGWSPGPSLQVSFLSFRLHLLLSSRQVFFFYMFVFLLDMDMLHCFFLYHVQWIDQIFGYLLLNPSSDELALMNGKIMILISEALQFVSRTHSATNINKLLGIRFCYVPIYRIIDDCSIINAQEGIESFSNGEVRLLKQEKSIIQEDDLDLRWEAATGEPVSEVILLSRHTAVSSRPALTVHPIGIILTFVACLSSAYLG